MSKFLILFFSLLVDALYGSKHPDFVAYLYLLAPISLTILNPLGFVMMEIGKPQSSPNGSESSHWQMFRSIIRNIITNPIVFMTALGIVGNIAFSHKPPVVLDCVLDVSRIKYNSWSQAIHYVDLYFSLFLYLSGIWKGIYGYCIDAFGLTHGW